MSGTRSMRALSFAAFVACAAMVLAATVARPAFAADPPPIVEFLETAIAKFSRGTLTLFSTDPDRYPGTGPNVAWLRGESIGSGFQYDNDGYVFDESRTEILNYLGDDCSTLSAPIDHPKRTLPSGAVVNSFTIRCHALDRAIPASLTYSFYPISQYIFMTVHSAARTNGEDIETDRALYTAVVRYMQNNPSRW